MKVIFTKKQIEMLREDNDTTKLDVTVNPNDPNKLDKIKYALSQPNVDDVNMARPSGTTMNQQMNPNEPEAHVELETNKQTPISTATISKAVQTADKAKLPIQFDSMAEGFVRYSKKELKEILFR